MSELDSLGPESDRTEWQSDLTILFGEIGILKGTPRTATIRVTEDGPLKTIELDRDAFRRLWEQSGETHSLISGIVAERLGRFAEPDRDDD